MARTATTKSARLEARLKPEHMRLLRQAAALQGRSVTDFVLSAAQEAAHKAIAEANVIRLTLEASETFAAAMINPPLSGKGLSRAFKRSLKLFGHV